MPEKQKHQCSNPACHDIATWRNISNAKYSCDNCVSRGCSCWWISNIEYDYALEDLKTIITDDVQIVKLEGGGYEHRDLCGQQLPCVDYDYCKEGFDVEENHQE